MEEEAPEAELISPRISFSHDLATFAAATTCPTTPSRPDTSSFLLSRRRRRLPAEPEFDFANAAAADVAPADRLFADGKLLPLPPLPPTTPHARVKQQTQPPPAWHKSTRPGPAPRSWASPFARSSSVNSAAASGRFTCPAFLLMRSRSVGGGSSVAAGAHRPHCKKVAPATTTNTAAGGVSGGRTVYYYGYGGGGSSRGGGGVRVSPVLNVTSIGTSVVNMLSYLLCDCGEIKGAKSRGIGVNCR